MHATTPFVTVIVCTRDRARSLARMLESLCRAAAGVDEPWELLVVDNGSSDDTPAVIAGFRDRLPIRRVEQPVAGVSHARNAGVAAASGEYVVWTDDDVVVSPDWLSTWMSGLRAQPGHAVYGGRARPVLEEPQQAWFRDNLLALRSLVALRDHPEWTEITSGRVPYGLNFAVRTTEQKAHPYDPGLGVGPGRRAAGGEETSVVRAILAAGGSGRWVWDAAVDHMIPQARQSERYISDYYRAHGYSYPLRYRGSGSGQYVVERTIGALRASLTLVRTTTSHALHRVLRGRSAAVPKLIHRARAVGTLRHYLGLGC